jgi:hypothetical protein
VAAWGTLPKAIRVAIMAIVDTATEPNSFD